MVESEKYARLERFVNITAGNAKVDNTPALREMAKMLGLDVGDVFYNYGNLPVRPSEVK